MKIFSWKQIENFKILNLSPFSNSAITIGCFEANHIGHKSIFNAVIDYAKNHSFAAGIVTFSNSFYKFNKNCNKAISKLSTRLDEYKREGFDFVVVIDFSNDFAKMNGIDFLSILVNVCKMRFIAEGKDFCCGYKGNCNIEQIKEFAKKNNVKAEFFDLVLYNNEKLSSSIIRNNILKGNFLEIEKMLGHSYFIDLDTISFEKSKNMYRLKKDRITQIIPQSGVYNIWLVTSSGNIRTRLVVDSKYIRLMDITGNAVPRIKGVQFISKEE